LYDVAHAAGLTTAEVDWVAIHNAETITWAFPERPRLTDAVAKELIEAGHITADGITSFAKAPITYRDEIWTIAGEHILEKHKPNLLLWHLLTTDSSQHRYGANSLAGSAALALADSKIARLVEALKRAGIFDRTAIFVVADHGFKTYKRVIQPNAVFGAKGLIRGEDCDVWSIPEGGTSMVYITRPGRKSELMQTLPGMLGSLEGVAQVLTPAEFDKFGYPQPDDRMADLVLAAKTGYAFTGAREGEPVTDVAGGSTPGAHGYLSTDADMNAVFVASGAGIRAGAKLGAMRTIDIAPTIARLLGLKLPDMQGRVLTEILA
jgi:predicted AlkP superfamily pyrophosphatase or phosphodiesterase